jgi:hypothetical protein
MYIYIYVMLLVNDHLFRAAQQQQASYISPSGVKICTAVPVVHSSICVSGSTTNCEILFVCSNVAVCHVAWLQSVQHIADKCSVWAVCTLTISHRNPQTRLVIGPIRKNCILLYLTNRYVIWLRHQTK